MIVQLKYRHYSCLSNVQNASSQPQELSFYREMLVIGLLPVKRITYAAESNSKWALAHKYDYKAAVFIFSAKL